MLPPWVKRYWRLYGGWRALFHSPYLYAAFVLSVACYPLWKPGSKIGWQDISINILPNLMGFSIAGMAIMLAFSHPKSLEAVTQKGKPDSYFLGVAANLCHFLVVQIIALLLAIVGKGIDDFWLLSFLGVFSLLYAILVSVAAAGQFFNTANIMNAAAWPHHSDRDGDGTDRDSERSGE